MSLTAITSEMVCATSAQRHGTTTHIVFPPHNAAPMTSTIRHETSDAVSPSTSVTLTPLGSMLDAHRYPLTGFTLPAIIWSFSDHPAHHTLRFAHASKPSISLRTAKLSPSRYRIMPRRIARVLPHESFALTAADTASRASLRLALHAQIEPASFTRPDSERTHLPFTYIFCVLRTALITSLLLRPWQRQLVRCLL